MAAGHFIGIDWGSSNARAMLFAPDGTRVDSREFPLGIKNIAGGAYRDAFHQMTDDWRAQRGPLRAILSGMIGSRHGWREAPYLACPASVDDLARHLLPVPDEPDVFIVPGMKMEGARPDVMRGEELQVLGLGASGVTSELVCIPGTHAKWIARDGALIREFHTAMTGELYAAITEHTLLAPLIPPAKPADPHLLNVAAFDAGLRRSADSHGLLHALFELRAAVLLGRIAAGELPDMISGLLVGTESRHAQALFQGRRDIVVLGAMAVRERYVHALASFGFNVLTFNVAEITACGFAALAAAAGWR